jgi:hypothetical protein
MKVLRLAPLALVLFLGGCQGWSVSQCVSPRVTGRVVDSETRQPLENVEVQRVAARTRQAGSSPPKGGQLMQDVPRIVLTSADGSFSLDAIYSVAVFRVLSWSSVDVQFRFPGYLALTTNFTPSVVSFSPDGGPLVNTGVILLHRKQSTTPPGVLLEGSSTTTTER